MPDLTPLRRLADTRPGYCTYPARSGWATPQPARSPAVVPVQPMTDLCPQPTMPAPVEAISAVTEAKPDESVPVPQSWWGRWVPRLRR